MNSRLCRGLLALVVITEAQSAFANVITDWDDKALVTVTPMANLGGTNPYLAQRMTAMVHAAMFDAVNSIERRYKPYLVQLPADPSTSKEAAAAGAAAKVLASIDPKTANEMSGVLASYLIAIPDGVAKSDGVKIGEAVAAKILEARLNDGCDAPDAYRPRTTPGVYVPTAITTLAERGVCRTGRLDITGPIREGTLVGTQASPHSPALPFEPLAGLQERR